ncbi:MAG TPA: response regulator [Longimicrobium sp.]|jgi:PAS domain S-box-containing protein|uniref:response regulator n=1 Tax=Longimicrobium sp. TaxID=2029185 RepID=UPI002ED8CA10
MTGPAAAPGQPIRVLLVEDDEDDFVITRGLLAEVTGAAFDVVWAATCTEGLRTLAGGEFDVVLLDYRLGRHTALDFLGRMPLAETTPPVILLTGADDTGTDVAAMRAGAVDFLAKAGLNATMLERSIRYAVERHGAQVARHSAERKFEMLLESVGAIVWQGDPDTLQFTYVSQEAEVLLGYPLEMWTRDPGFWSAHIHEADRAWAVALCREAARNNVPRTCDYRMIAADGRTVWLRDIVKVVNVGGRRELAGVMVDVTQAKSVEQDLRLRDRAIAAVEEGIIITDPHQPDDPIVYVNPGFERMTGYPAADVVGMNCRFLQGAGTDPAAVAGIRRALQAAEPIRTELLNYRHDGTPFWNRLSITPVQDELGSLTHFVGVQRDVTADRSREQKVHLLASALEGLDEQGVSIVTAEGEWVFSNRTHGRLLGYDAGADPAPTVDAFLPDDDARREFEHMLATVRNTGSWSGRVRRRRLSDGAIIVLDTFAGGVEEQGRTLFFTIIQDASEAIAHERHLRRAERLAGIGTLVAGVAHELNNPLSAVLGFAQMLLLDARTESERDDLRTIIREAERMANIVSDLRAVARDTQEETGTREPIDLNDVVRHVLKTRAYSLTTRNVETSEDLADGLPIVSADRGQLEQVLLNLVVNAEQAMDESGGDRRLAVRTRPAPMGVSVEIIDTGTGIPAHHLDRIFDPFFTTKAPGHGTGLGLSLVHSIVTEHGGEIRVDSEAGRGTTFRIDLPGSTAAPAPVPGPAPERTDELPGSPLRVLVVDDEDAVRRVLVRILRRRGHHADEAAEGGQALQVLESDERGYDVIVSDLRMPGLDGEELLKRLQARGEGLERRVLFLTGDIASAQAARTLAEARVPALAKPVSAAEFLAAVEKIGYGAGSGP